MCVECKKKKKRIECKNMSDNYIKKLTQNSPLSHKDIPQELVELKRAELKLNRSVREKKKETQ